MAEDFVRRLREGENPNIDAVVLQHPKLAGLIYGRWIFAGPAVHPKFQMVSYAFLTMIVILAPAVLDTGGSTAGAAFWSRTMLFILIAVYGTLAVRVFDAFWPGIPAALEDRQSV